MKTGTYKDIYQKILDGGYSSTNTDKKNQQRQSSPSQLNTFLEENKSQSGIHLESFDLSKDFNRTTESQIRESMIQKTGAGEDDSEPLLLPFETSKQSDKNKLP